MQFSNFTARCFYANYFYGRLREIWHTDANWASKPKRKLKFPTFKNLRWRTAAILKIENRPYLWNGLADLCEIWYDDAHWAAESDRQLNFQILTIQDGERPPFLKNGKSAIEQYLLKRMFVSNVPYTE